MRSEYRTQIKALGRIFQGILLILLFMAFYAQGHARQDGGPRMVLEEKKFDAGEVKEGRIIEHSFKVYNKGDRDLVIEDVDPG